MSLHKKPLTKKEHLGLTLHGLDIGTPSQLSDVFRHGMAYADEWISVDKLLPQNDWSVICACDDDVEQCLHFDDGCFIDSYGKEFKATHWMEKPLPPAHKD